MSEFPRPATPTLCLASIQLLQCSYLLQCDCYTPKNDLEKSIGSVACNVAVCVDHIYSYK